MQEIHVLSIYGFDYKGNGRPKGYDRIMYSQIYPFGNFAVLHLANLVILGLSSGILLHFSTVLEQLESNS